MRTLSRAFITAVLLSAVAGSALAQPAAKRPAAPRGPAVPSAALPKAAAPASPGEGDERCLLAMALLTQDKQRAQIASLAMVFYAGRLSARGLDVPSAVEHAKAKLTPQQIPAELQRCGPAFQTSMTSMQKTFAPPPGAQPPAAGAPPAAAPPAAAPPAATPPAPAPK